MGCLPTSLPYGGGGATTVENGLPETRGGALLGFPLWSQVPRVPEAIDNSWLQQTALHGWPAAHVGPTGSLALRP